MYQQRKVVAKSLVVSASPQQPLYPELTTVLIYILCLNNQVSGHSTGMKADANVKTAFEIVHVALIKSTVGKP